MNNLSKFVKTFLEDSKATEIISFDVKNKSDVTDCMIIATGNSNRQVKSLAQNLVAECKKSAIAVFSHEGTDWWVLVDLGEVIVHIMQAEAREYYQLEKLWGTESSKEFVSKILVE